MNVRGAIVDLCTLAPFIYRDSALLEPAYWGPSPLLEQVVPLSVCTQLYRDRIGTCRLRQQSAYAIKH